MPRTLHAASANNLGYITSNCYKDQGLLYSCALQLYNISKYCSYVGLTQSAFTPAAASLQRTTRQSWTTDSAPGVATWEVTLSTRKVPRASVGLKLVLLRTFYSQAQGCVCTALQLGGDVETILAYEQI